MFDLEKLLHNKNQYDSVEYLGEIVRNAVTGAATFEDVLESGGLRSLFEAVLPAQVAADLCDVVGRLGMYTYGFNSYRRSYRSGNPVDYEDKILNIAKAVYGAWDSFDLVDYIRTGKTGDEDGEQVFYRYRWTKELLIALRIDRNDEQIIEAVTDVLLSENNTTAVSHELMRSVAMSHNLELHGLLKDLLLAAKLQEGLRQAIFETADDGCVEYFTLIIQTMLKNNLLRFSSALRAVDVWMGLGYDYEDKRSVEKLLKLGLTYLEDETARAAAVGSADVTEMYAAMWAESVFSVERINSHIEKYLTNGKKYQKMVSAYFLNETGSEETCIELSGAALSERNLDLLALVMRSYSLPEYRIIESVWGEGDPIEKAKKQKIRMEQYPACYKNDSVRDAHFRHLSEIFDSVPQKGHSVVGKPFDWVHAELTRDAVYRSMHLLAIYDFDPQKTKRLRELFPTVGSDYKSKYLSFVVCKEYLESNDITGDNRELLFECLSDKSMAVRMEAAKTLTHLRLSEQELESVEKLLGLKTAGIRKAALETIQKSDGVLNSVKRLISDKNQNKRLAALDLLANAKKQDKIAEGDIKEYIALMPVRTGAEDILIDTLLSRDDGLYTKENGFGLYEPLYFPELPPVEQDKVYNLESFRRIGAEEMLAAFNSLRRLIEKHKDYEYRSYNYDGQAVDFVLGARSYLSSTAKRDEKSDDPFSDYPLSEVWRGWLAENDLPVIVKIAYCFEVKKISFPDKNYNESVADLIGQHFGVNEVKAFWEALDDKNYVALAGNIIRYLISLAVDKSVLFDIYYGIAADFYLSVDEEDWQKPCFSEGARYNWQSTKLADLDEVEFFLNRIKDNTDEQFLKKLALLYRIGAATGVRFHRMNVGDIARAVVAGIVEKSELRRFIVESGHRVLANYTGTLYHEAQKIAEKYPMLPECVQDVVVRVIEIELKRGDTETPVSHLANMIRLHKGAENFAELLTALGKETLTRGYSWYGDGYSKRDVLSSLLKANAPAPQDNAETLKAALDGRISEKRLLEAVMYAPAWISIAEDYLKWPGLKSAAWYFHAHTRDSYSAEFETEVSRYSPIDKEDFQQGAFDIEWFKESYKTLGAERFAMLYDSAKYISGGATHRRAQLFADAALGKLKARDLEKQIKAKRNKDLLICYSLIPLKKQDALRRYEFIHGFLKESRKFGAQRQQSEKTASNIALDNLARNLGFTDVLRFSWKMEMQKLDQIQDYFKPREIGGVTLFLEWGEAGNTEIIVDKDGKRLKSVPKALAKDKYVLDLKETKSSLKVQFSRARLGLEKSMENRDAFTFEYAAELLGHPVIGPMLEKLVFRFKDELGFITETGLRHTNGDVTPLQGEDEMTIAHCYDLFILDKWAQLQRYAFENSLVQPFKQIFRELYVINEDEKAERTISRRYAGHQIQPRKTVALLKGRGWTVDYENGLQKVYHKENVIATMYALADWFSPGEVEAPTLETVRFFQRKTGKSLLLEDINPVLFSEIMRDVDLVVSVAHVGGVDPMASHSTIEMRGVIVSESVRQFKLTNVEISDRFARIKGTRGEYTVHLGSAQVQMMGRGALNILPVHSQHRGRIFLPFIDEDPKTAEIVSKVLLLGEDEKIKDPSILPR